MEFPNQAYPSAHPVAVVAQHPSPKPAQIAYDFSRPEYGFDTADESNSESLLACWRILLRHKWAVLGATLGGLVIGFLLGVPMKPVYRAQTMVEVLSLNEDFMNMRQSRPVSTNDNSYDTSEEQTQARLLQSDALLKRVENQLDPEMASGKHKRLAPRDNWRVLLNLPAPVVLSERQKLLDRAIRTLKVRPTGRTRLLEVTADSTDPKFAAEFVNTLLQQFVAMNMEARWSDTQRTSEWLRREIEDARSRLKSSEDALQSYARGSGLIFTDDSTNVVTEKLQQIQQEFSSATADRIAKQSRYELAKNSPPDSLADVLNDAGLRATSAKVSDLRRQIADLSAVYTPEYSKIKRLDAELVTLEAAFEHDRADVLSRIQTDYQESLRRENLLSLAYLTQTKEVSGQGEKAIQYNILKREVDSNRQLYDTMLQQTKQASVASAMRASNVRVVDPADPPTIPVSPNLKLNAVVGAFLGLVTSLGFVLISERADRTLQQPGDAQLWTNLPELGAIPSSAVDAQKRFYGPHNATPSVDAAPLTVGMPSNAPARTHSVELMTWESKPSLVAEAFRSVLTSILFVGENGNRPRVLVMTSANASEGKTTVVSNLGIAMAEIRRKVLIIDADLRRPRMHQLFSLQNERGLSDVLRTQQISEQQEVNGLICHTSVPGLDVLPSGPATHAAANLLYSPHLATLISRFREQYDMVLIDTPPMLQMTDARVAARLADGVVVVARAGKTTRDAITALTQRFKEDRSRVLGTILNDWNPKRSPRGYYGYYTKPQAAYELSRN